MTKLGKGGVTRVQASEQQEYLGKQGHLMKAGSRF